MVCKWENKAKLRNEIINVFGTLKVNFTTVSFFCIFLYRILIPVLSVIYLCLHFLLVYTNMLPRKPETCFQLIQRLGSFSSFFKGFQLFVSHMFFLTCSLCDVYSHVSNVFYSGSSDATLLLIMLRFSEYR